MACTKVKLQNQLSRSLLGLQESTATQVYIVEFNSIATPQEAEAATDGTNTIPSVGTLLTGDTHGRYVKSLEARGMDESHRHYTVQVDYSNQIEFNPLSLPDEISWDFNDSSQAYFLDCDPGGAKPTVNSAGELFENLLERETGSIRATVKRNIAANAYSPATAVAYKDATNSNSFTIDGVSIATGQVKLKSYTCGPIQKIQVYGAWVYYRQATYVLDFKADWRDKIDDRGFNEKYTDSGSHIKLREIVKGQPPVKPDKPWPLNGSGAAKPNATDTPSVLTFYPYAQMSFSVFSFS